MMNKKEQKDVARKIRGFLQSIDIYAKPISLTYKGRLRYTTSCGGLISLFVIIFIMSIVTFYCGDLLSRSKT